MSDTVPHRTRIAFGVGSAYVSGFLLSARTHGRFDKRATIVATAPTWSVFPAMPVILRLFGYFPDNGSTAFPDNGTTALMWAIAGFGALGPVSGSVLDMSVMSALADIADAADIADENAFRQGVRQEGILYSAWTFFAKPDASPGHGVAAAALAVIAFPEKAEPGDVAMCPRTRSGGWA